MTRLSPGSPSQIRAGLDLSTCEPFSEGRIPFQGLGKRFEPSKFFPRQITPKTAEIAACAIIKLAIGFHAAHVGLSDKLLARRIDFCVGHVCARSSASLAQAP